MIEFWSLQPDPNTKHLKGRGILADILSGSSMERKPQSGFWHGFGSVLTLVPPPRVARIVFYNGQDLARVTVVESLQSDWQQVIMGPCSPLKDARVNDPFARSERELAADRR